MKYTDTSKILSLVFHTLLFLAFGALGIYFGVFVVPGYFTANTTYIEFSDELKLISSSYVIYFELAVIGIAIAGVAVKGVIDALKALKNNSDADVVNSFACFIAEGWLAAIFFIINGGLFYGIIAGESSVWFVIVMCVIFALALLIAVNIPTVKLFDGKDSTPLISSLSLAGLTSGVPMFALPLLSLLFLLPSTVQTVYVGRVQFQLIAIAILGAAILVASIVSKLTSKKGVAKAASLAVSGASFVAAADLITLAIVNFTWSNSNMTSGFIVCNKYVGVLGDAKWAVSYNVMLIVFGVALLCLALAVIALPSKKKAK